MLLSFILDNIDRYIRKHDVTKYLAFFRISSDDDWPLENIRYAKRSNTN